MPVELKDVCLSGELTDIKIGGTDDNQSAAVREYVDSSLAAKQDVATFYSNVEGHLLGGDQAAIYLGGTAPENSVMTAGDVDTLMQTKQNSSELDADVEALLLGGTIPEINVGGTDDDHEVITLGSLNSILQAGINYISGVKVTASDLSVDNMSLGGQIYMPQADSPGYYNNFVLAVGANGCLKLRNIQSNEKMWSTNYTSDLGLGAGIETAAICTVNPNGTFGVYESAFEFSFKVSSTATATREVTGRVYINGVVSTTRTVRVLPGATLQPVTFSGPAGNITSTDQVHVTLQCDGAGVTMRGASGFGAVFYVFHARTVADRIFHTGLTGSTLSESEIDTVLGGESVLDAESFLVTKTSTLFRVTKYSGSYYTVILTQAT